MNGKYRLSITGPAVSILIDTLLYQYFPSLIKNDSCDSSGKFDSMSVSSTNKTKLAFY